MATIGIKIANGNFYPLLDENDPQKKKIALIPARTGQKRAQIDFYKSESLDRGDVQLIGCLSFGDGKKEMDEDDGIDIDIEANGQGKIGAIAKNVKTGECRELVIWLKAVDGDDARESIREGERESGRENGGGKIERLETPEIIEENAGLLPIDLLYEQKSVKKFPLVPICIVALSLAAICGLLWFFLAREKAPATEKATGAASAETPAEPVPAEPFAVARAEKPPKQYLAAIARTEKPSEQDPATDARSDSSGVAVHGEIANPAQSEQRLKRPPAPVRSYKAPEPIPKNGATYKARWGDTLWDIADVFYNNPWLYTRLARYNKIRPSAILSPGVVLRLPPKL
ncbi:MAG: LysM peptidoglycan-binding domain-containing protein [Treponema sp.]|nr:LysM peptidoglycan-binding domain-containing protein [Treponema sp.]